MPSYHVEPACDAGLPDYNVLLSLRFRVFLHDGVENLVQLVCTTPMGARNPAETFGRHRRAEQLIGGLGCCFGLALAGADDFFIAAKASHR